MNHRYLLPVIGVVLLTAMPLAAQPSKTYTPRGPAGNMDESHHYAL